MNDIDYLLIIFFFFFSSILFQVSPHLQQDHKVIVLAYMARQKGLLDKAEQEVLRVLSVTQHHQVVVMMLVQKKN